jgi:hypothetical protein
MNHLLYEVDMMVWQALAGIDTNLAELTLNSNSYFICLFQVVYSKGSCFASTEELNCIKLYDSYELLANSLSYKLILCDRHLHVN